MTLPPLPQLPATPYVLASEGGEYERGYITSLDGYTADELRTYAEQYGRLCAEAERADMPEPPDDDELEAWRSAADKLLLEHRSHDMRRIAMLLQNAYLFGRAIRARGTR